MEMQFQIGETYQIHFSAGGGKSDTSKEVVPGNAIIIAGSYGRFFINENAPYGEAAEVEE